MGSKWTQEVAHKSGCDILLSQSHLIVTPRENAEARNVTRAIELVEDTLVGALGVQESKCRLIYDLTESYSQVGPNGVLLIRDPFISNRHTWASIVDMPVYINQEGGQRYLLKPFIESEIMLHKLKCSAKVCGQSFGIPLRHCDPYVMVCLCMLGAFQLFLVKNISVTKLVRFPLSMKIMGRKKDDVWCAVEHVRKAIKKHQHQAKLILRNNVLLV